MKATDLNILFIGDSITSGEFIDPSERFPSLIKKRLTQDLDRDINLGALCKNGWTTRLALSNEGWSDAMRFSPEIAVIQFGLNDCSRWITDKGIRRVNSMSFEFNLREMITRLQLSGCGKIFLINIHKTDKDTDYEKDAFTYSSIIESLAIDEMVHTIHVRKNIRFIHLLPDGIHLNRKGHRAYARIILKAFGDLS